MDITTFNGSALSVFTPLIFEMQLKMGHYFTHQYTHQSNHVNQILALMFYSNFFVWAIIFF